MFYLPSEIQLGWYGKGAKIKKRESMVFDHQGGGVSAKTKSLFRFEERFKTLNIASSGHVFGEKLQIGLVFITIFLCSLDIKTEIG